MVIVMVMGMGMHDDVIEDLTVSIIKEEDAVQMIELQMRLADETVFLLRALDEVEIDAEKQRDEIRKNRNDVSSFLFGAYIKGKLVGFLSGSRGKFSRNQHVAHLAIGVLEAYWGKGVAKRLMTSFITWAKEVDISRIEMEVVEDNQRALAFCYHFGFKIEGKKESDHFVKEDKYLNTYVLGKIIDRKIITD